jgi:hypothetical protein
MNTKSVKDRLPEPPKTRTIKDKDMTILTIIFIALTIGYICGVSLFL